MGPIVLLQQGLLVALVSFLALYPSVAALSAWASCPLYWESCS